MKHFTLLGTDSLAKTHVESMDFSEIMCASSTPSAILPSFNLWQTKLDKGKKLKWLPIF